MSYVFAPPLGLVLAQLLVAPAAAAQTFSYVTTLHGDTVAIEQFQRTGSRIVGVFAKTVRDSVTVHHFTVDLSPDRTVERATFESRNAGGGVDSAVMTFVGDSAIIESNRIAEGTRRLHLPGAFPMVVGSMAFEELAARHALSLHRDTVLVPVVGLEWLGTGRFWVVVFSPDSVGVWAPRTPALLLFDSEGHVRRNTAVLTGVPTETLRVSTLDFDALVSSFAARP